MRKINTKPAATAKPVSTTAKLAARVIASVSGKPKTNAGKPVPPKHPEAAAPARPANVVGPRSAALLAAEKLARDTGDSSLAAADISRPANVTRTARTIVAQRANFGGLSDRDNAYLAFFAGFAKRDGGTVTLPAIVESGRRPSYVGSNKPHDAGVIIRLGKAGLLSHNADATAFVLTDKARSLAAFTSAPIAPRV